MGARITKEQVEERLNGTGIKVVSYSGMSSSKSLFECELGHRWETLAHVLTNLKCGCPTCAGNTVVTIEDARVRLKKKNISVLEWEGKTKNKAKFKCEICNYEWQAGMGNVLSVSGCKKCAGLVKRTKNEINLELENRKIKCIDYCGSSSGKSKFKCDICDNEWHSTYSSIRNGKNRKGTGCSKCASYGFSTAKNSVLYVLSLSDKAHGEFIGYGITNNYKSRIAKHKSTFRKFNVEFKEVAKFNFEFGIDASNIEKKLKELSVKSGFICSIPGFLTESLDNNLLTDAMLIIIDGIK